MAQVYYDTTILAGLFHSNCCRAGSFRKWVGGGGWGWVSGCSFLFCFVLFCKPSQAGLLSIYRWDEWLTLRNNVCARFMQVVSAGVWCILSICYQVYFTSVFIPGTAAVSLYTVPVPWNALWYGRHACGPPFQWVSAQTALDTKRAFMAASATYMLLLFLFLSLPVSVLPMHDNDDDHDDDARDAREGVYVRLMS